MSNSAFPGCSQRNISLIMASVQPYILYTYIFLTVVIEECDGPRAFVLRWGGAEEANQRDHGHLRIPAARSHTMAPVSLQSGCRKTNSAILSTTYLCIYHNKCAVVL